MIDEAFVDPMSDDASMANISSVFIVNQMLRNSLNNDVRFLIAFLLDPIISVGFSSARFMQSESSSLLLLPFRCRVSRVNHPASQITRLHLTAACVSNVLACRSVSSGEDRIVGIAIESAKKRNKNR